MEVTEEQVLEYVRSQIDGELLEHTLRVLEYSSELAKRNGQDQVACERVRIAALLHDSAKNIPPAKLLEISLKHDHPIDPVERDHPGLLHGAVAAFLAREELGIDDPSILRAVSFHTTGEEEMDVVARLLYIADFAEPGRDHPTASTAREIADRNIDEAFRYVVGERLHYLIDSGKAIIPRTLHLWNTLTADSG